MSEGVPACSRPSAKSATSAPSLMVEPACSAVQRSLEEPSVGAPLGLLLAVGVELALLAESLLPPHPAATPPSESRTAAIRTCFMRFGPLLEVDMGKSTTVPCEPEEQLSGAGHPGPSPSGAATRGPRRRWAEMGVQPGKTAGEGTFSALPRRRR